MTSEHFKEHELACKHCGMNDVTSDLLSLAEAVRAVLGAPMVVHSAYRCAVHNKAVGGSSNSQHVQGRAMDFHVSGMTPEQVYTTIKAAHAAGALPKLGGLGLYDWGVHIDCRTAAPLVTWDYRTKGRGT